MSFPADLPSLRQLWEQERGWVDASQEDYILFVQRILDCHEPFLALDVLNTVVTKWPQTVPLVLLQAKALIKCGAVHRAFALIDRLFRDGHEELEIVLQLAHLSRERARREHVTASRDRLLHHAVVLCERLLRQYDALSSLLDVAQASVETATLCLFVGKTQEAETLARVARDQCAAHVPNITLNESDGFRLHAVLAQAALIVNDGEEATQHLRRTGELGRWLLGHGRLEELGYTRRNCQRILEFRNQDLGVLAWWKMPSVVVFTGHMIDKPGRAIPRFPADQEDWVKARIVDKLAQMDGCIGYGSGACGGDILFHEAMAEARGGQIHVVLPCPKEEFITGCIQGFPGREWPARFERICNRASSLVILSDQCANDNAMASESCNRVILGLAKMKAETLGCEVKVLALWDGREGDAIGGTHSMVQFCRTAAVEVTILDVLTPAHTAREAHPSSLPVGQSSRVRLAGADFDPSQQLCAMLFADAVRFSRLTERQIPNFVDYYLRGIARLVQAAGNASLAINTWGDGLHIVFDSVQAAGLFALDFRDFVRDTDFQITGLPPDFSARIALHAGPVYRIEDPLLHRPNYLGSHVNMAARIEPKTPAGQVYCSQIFAALAAAQGVTAFKCEYIGAVEWAKGYGEHPTYVVERTAGFV